MERFGILPKATLSRKNSLADQVLAPRGDPLREARFSLPLYRDYRMVNGLHWRQ